LLANPCATHFEKTFTRNIAVAFESATAFLGAKMGAKVEWGQQDGQIRLVYLSPLNGLCDG
jgi:hypothetical protein